MQACYDKKPSIYEAVGNGSYLYRWDIKEETVTTTSDGKEQKRTQWSCQEVTVWSPVTCNAIVRTVLAEKWDSDHEQKLINEYYSAQMGIYDEGTAKKATEAYKTFLTERATLKAQVEKDCKGLGID